MKTKFVRLGFISAALALAFSSTLAILIPATANAFSFDGNRIIDDRVFNNVNSLSALQIDGFLNSFPNSCISTNSGFAAIKPTGYNPSQGYLYGDYASAGTIISTAASAYGLNPQVLLATLQKEQSLVMGGSGFCNNGDENKYTAAVGYGCPDSGTVHSYTGLSLYRRNGVVHSATGSTCVDTAIKSGFSQQVIRAAWLFKFGQQHALGNYNWAVINSTWDNTDDLNTCYAGPMTPGNWKTCSSSAATYFDGYRTIDGSSVKMTTGATAALYWYTPHFHGNQNFFNLFTGWFGSPYANDTDVPHPDGTLINDGQGIYLLSNGTRQHILNPSVFYSYNYRWSDAKPASSGDNALPLGTEITAIAPGTVFTMGDGKVYMVDLVGGVLKKRWLTAGSFAALGYGGNDVANYPAGDVTIPSDGSTPYNGTQHPAGSLVSSASAGKIYQMGGSNLRHVISPLAFLSYNFNWNKVHPVTGTDAALPESSPIDTKPGTMMLSNGIFVASYDTSGLYKRPVGPWECYADRLNYNSADWISVTPAALPARTGGIYSC